MRRFLARSIPVRWWHRRRAWTGCRICDKPFPRGAGATEWDCDQFCAEQAEELSRRAAERR